MSTRSIEKVDGAAGLRWLRAQLRLRSGRTLVAVDGVDGAGKTTFANDLAELLRESGLTVIRVSMDDYLNPQVKRYAQGRTSPKGFVEDSYDYQRFAAEVLEPLGRDGCGRYRTRAYDLTSDTEVAAPYQVAPDDAVVIVDGLFMHRAAWCSAGHKIWDLSVWLEVPFDESFRRMAARDGRSPDPNDPANLRYYRGQQIYLSECDPAHHADLVIDTVAPHSAADD